MRGQVEAGLCLREVADGGHLLRRLAHVPRRDGLMLHLRVLLDLQLEVDRPLLVLLLRRVRVGGQLGDGVVVARGAGGARVGGGVEAAAAGRRHAGRGAARHNRGRGRVVLVVELLMRSWFEDGTFVLWSSFNSKQDPCHLRSQPCHCYATLELQVRSIALGTEQ